MAIFYNHIKGCGQFATNTHTGTYPSGSNLELEDAWSFIKFADIIYYKKPTSDSTSDLTSVQNSPIIYLNAPNAANPYISNFKYSKEYDESAEDFLETDKRYTDEISSSLGHILTTNARDQYVNKDLAFKTSATTNKLIIRKDADTDNPIVLDTTVSDISINMNLYNTSQLRLYRDTEAAVTGIPPTEQPKKYARLSYQYIEKTDSNGLDKNYEYLDINSGSSGTPIVLTSTGVVLREGGLYARDLSSAGQTEVPQGVIKADLQCEAKYFNATSDRRAKSNIRLAEFSALNTIKQLPIYTFNYLNDPKLSVGLIAQEAAEYNLDGFNMVDNLDASGEFGDFMQMKESKLVYVLWKAVQELSAEVEELKAEIASLK